MSARGEHSGSFPLALLPSPLYPFMPRHSVNIFSSCLLFSSPHSLSLSLSLNLCHGDHSLGMLASLLHRNHDLCYPYHVALVFNSDSTYILHSVKFIFSSYRLLNITLRNIGNLYCFLSKNFVLRVLTCIIERSKHQFTLNPADFYFPSWNVLRYWAKVCFAFEFTSSLF